MAPGLIRRALGERPLYVEPSGRIWFSRDASLVARDIGKAHETTYGRWPPSWRDHAGKLSRLAARLLRSGLRGLLPLPGGGILVLARGRLFRSGGAGQPFAEVLAIPKGSGPLNICLTPQGQLYFGEYFFNDGRDQVRIFASTDGGESWSVIYAFARGEVRHVHSIIYDPFRGGCWVTTGDSDAESRILFTADGFRTLETVFAGEQRYRTVGLIPSADSLLTATDTPLEPNFIQRLFPESGRSEKIQDVSGSVFGMTRAGRFCIASVAVEPSRVNLARDAKLLVSEDGERWFELYRQAKDRWQLPYTRLLPDTFAELPFFQHGSFELPWGSADVPLLFAYAQALVNDDDHLLAWDLEKALSALTKGGAGERCHP